MNTLGPGMVINIEMRKPVLANKVGGVSGPALKPITIKYVYDIHRALPNIPIIATGGMMTGEDAIEALMAGATLVGVGTGVYYRGVEVFKKMTDEMNDWCGKNNVKKLTELIGAVV